MVTLRFGFLRVAALSVATVCAAHAHHAIGEIYDEDRSIAIEGQIESFLFDNPHSLLHIKVSEANGESRTWAVEWRAAARLERLGLSAGALTPGEVVMVCGNPGRDPAAYRLYLLDFERLSGRAPRMGVGDGACHTE